MNNEQAAIAVSQNRKALKKRLMSAKSCLVNGLRSMFQKNIIDFDKKLMVSDNGKYALVWKCRRWPNLPESYENQQTTGGDVYFVNLDVH